MKGSLFPVKISDVILSAKGETSLQQSATAGNMWDLNSQYDNCSECYPGNYKFLPKDAQSVCGSAGERVLRFPLQQFRQIPGSDLQSQTFLSLCWASALVVIRVSFYLPIF